MDVQEFSSDAPVASIASALRGDGAAMVHNLAPAETADAVAGGLRAYFDAEGTYAQCVGARLSEPRPHVFESGI